MGYRRFRNLHTPTRTGCFTRVLSTCGSSQGTSFQKAILSQRPQSWFYYFYRLTSFVMFVGFSISTVSVALGALTLWHAILITRGETSIERHINNKEAKRLAKRGKVRVHSGRSESKFRFSLFKQSRMIGI